MSKKIIIEGVAVTGVCSSRCSTRECEPGRVLSYADNGQTRCRCGTALLDVQPTTITLTERMLLVLDVLYKHKDDTASAMTPNRLAMRCGFRRGSDHSAHDGRAVALANRVNFAVTALKKRLLVRSSFEDDKTIIGITGYGCIVRQATRKQKA